MFNFFHPVWQLKQIMRNLVEKGPATTSTKDVVEEDALFRKNGNTFPDE